MTKIKNKNNNERKDAKRKRSNKPQYETKKEKQLKTNKPKTSDKKTIHGRKKHTELFKSLFCCFY